MAALLSTSRNFMRNSFVNSFKSVLRNPKQISKNIIAAQVTLQQHNKIGSVASLVPEEIKKMYEKSLKDPDSFWGTHGRDSLHWIKDFETVTNSDMNKGKHEWFLGGKLNVSG